MYFTQSNIVFIIYRENNLLGCINKLTPTILKKLGKIVLLREYLLHHYNRLYNIFQR